MSKGVLRAPSFWVQAGEAGNNRSFSGSAKNALDRSTP